MDDLLQHPLGCPVALSSYTVLLRDVKPGSPVAIVCAGIYKYSKVVTKTHLVLAAQMLCV